MTLDTRAYLNLSALAYIDFNKSLTGLIIKELIERKAVTEKDLNSPELSVLQNSSNPLRSWKVIAQSPFSVSQYRNKLQNYQSVASCLFLR